MSDMIVPDEAKVVRGRIEDPDRVARKHGWTILGWAGLFVAVTGAIDLLLGRFPFDPANPEWRFETATAMTTELKMPGVGLAMAMASVVGLRRHRTARATALGLAILAAITAAAGYYLLSVSPSILEQASHPATQALAQQTITRAAVRAIAYTGAFALMAGAGWRYT